MRAATEVCWLIIDTGAANGTPNDRAVELQPGLEQEFGSAVGIRTPTDRPARAYAETTAQRAASAQ
jgi:hypothetical protein